MESLYYLLGRRVNLHFFQGEKLNLIFLIGYQWTPLNSSVTLKNAETGPQLIRQSVGESWNLHFFTNSPEDFTKIAETLT